MKSSAVPVIGASGSRSFWSTIILLLGMTNEGSFLSHLRIKGSGADGIYRMVMKLAILFIWLKPILGVQRVVSNQIFVFSPTDKVPLTSKNGIPFLNVF